MSELLADAFSAVFVPGIPPNAAEHQVCIGVLDDVFLSPVAGHLSGLNGSSDAGPDGIHLYMLRACSEALTLPLYLLFVRSLNEGVLPTLWKTAIVAPLFKSGNRCDSLNYHPVSLTSVCCKVSERIIVSQLVDYLESHGLLSVHQFGFCKGRSVEDQLLVTYAEVVDAADEGLTEIERARLFSIYGRLLRADLIKCWKIFHRELDVGLRGVFSMAVDRWTRGHSSKLVLPRCNLEMRKRFFI